jgi:PhzF family phenazine biosynthesis protein
MSIPIVQVDAFASAPFTGNPAAVCFAPRDASDEWLRKVAMEMNLSETAFLWEREARQYRLRWFTPAVEVDLCGHATLASAHAIWERSPREPLTFHTKSGALTATPRGDRIELDFPATMPQPCDAPDGLLDALELEQAEVLRSRFDYVVIVDDETQVRLLNPDHRRLRSLPVRGVMVTAQGTEHDFVSRFFAPGAGVDEDPVTGSAHCALAPLWKSRLGKDVMRAYQASPRGGEIEVEPRGDRVLLRGRAITVLRGELLA